MCVPEIVHIPLFHGQQYPRRAPLRLAERPWRVFALQLGEVAKSEEAAVNACTESPSWGRALASCRSP